MNRAALLHRTSPMIMRAASGASYSANSGETAMRRKLQQLRDKDDATEARNRRLPLLTDAEAKALNVGAYVVKRKKVKACAFTR